jgi:hypothetical protein
MPFASRERRVAAGDRAALDPARGPSVKCALVRYADFSYQAQSWNRSRRVVAKVEWHKGELFPRVGFIVTNLTVRPNGSSDSITSGERRSNGSRRARMR